MGETPSVRDPPSGTVKRSPFLKESKVKQFLIMQNMRNLYVVTESSFLTRDIRTAGSRDQSVRIGPKFSKFLWSWSDQVRNSKISSVLVRWLKNVADTGPVLDFSKFSGLAGFDPWSTDRGSQFLTWAISLKKIYGPFNNSSHKVTLESAYTITLQPKIKKNLEELREMGEKPTSNRKTMCQCQCQMEQKI